MITTQLCPLPNCDNCAPQTVQPGAMAPGCRVCNSIPARLCKRCHSIRYCSPRCQKIDWPSHKLLCPQCDHDDVRPSPLHRRAILFRDSEKEPEFIWIECKEREQLGQKWEAPQKVRDYLGPNLTWMERTSCHHDKIHDRPLENSLEIFNRDTGSIDGSSPNQSIIAATQGDLTHDWRGPVVVLRKNGHCNTYEGSFGDMSMADYVHIVDHFKTY